MFTTSIGGSQTELSGANASAQQQIAETMDNFLLMLTTQLQNQDPLSPMDNAEFTNQLIGFSTVEQAIAQNQKLDDLMALMGGSAVHGLLDYMGLLVEVSGSGFPFGGQPAELAYAVGGGAAEVNLSIRDANGQVVWTGTGETGAGKHWLTWDGHDAEGEPLPAGEYFLSAEALDADGQAVATNTFVTALVSGVEHVQGGTLLKVGDSYLDPADILSVRQPAPPATS